MTSDKDKKIEDAAIVYEIPFTRIENDIMDFHVKDAFTAGANFGYELAQEELNHINLTLHEKITELEEQLKDGESSFLKVTDWNENLQKICNDKDVINTGLNAINKTLMSKITELEQQLKKIETHLKTHGLIYEHEYQYLKSRGE